MGELKMVDSDESRWDEYIKADWLTSLDETPFLKKCRNGTVTELELKTFLVQQYFYARHFTRYLCALLSNITNESDRRELTENLADETGLGENKGIPHSILFRQMLDKMGINPDQHEIAPSTRALVDTMFESCRNPNYAVGLGALCLGAEAIVPHLYQQIVHGFESKGYTKNDLDFFYLHIGCDDEHALTMKKIIDREKEDSRKFSALQCSASRVIAARTRFFESMTSNNQEVQHVAF